MRGGGRHVDPDGQPAGMAHLRAEPAVEGSCTLGERFEDCGPALRRTVVGDDELDTAYRRRPDGNLDARERPALDCLLGRLAEDLVEGDRCVLTDLVGIRDVDVDLDVVARREPASAPAAAAKPSLPSTRGSRSSQSWRRSRAASRASSRPLAKTSRARSDSPLSRSARPVSSICEIAESCWTGPSWISSATRRRSSCSESMRSARSARSISSEVNRSSLRATRSRPPACACRPRASRGCAARDSSRSPG